MSAQSAWLPPLASAIAACIAAAITAAAMVKSARRAAETAQRTADSSGAASVQVARIEQQVASDAHFAKWWESEHQANAVLAEARRLEGIENERLKAEIKSCRGELQDRDDDIAFLISVLTEAGLESVVVRRMQEENEQRVTERNSGDIKASTP